MDQRKIMELLKEAANPECSWVRRNEIRWEFIHASAGVNDEGALEFDTPEAGMLHVLEYVYEKTIHNRLDMLPALFPLFAAVSGDRRRGFNSPDAIDFSLMSDFKG